DGFGARSKNAEIAPRIHHSRGCAFFLKSSDCFVDREAFGDSPKIHEEWLSEPYPVSDNEINICRRAGAAKAFPPARQPAGTDQRRRDGDVEQTFSQHMQFHGAVKDAAGPGVHPYRSLRRALIESTDVAGRCVKAHEALYALDRDEGRVHGL